MIGKLFVIAGVLAFELGAQTTVVGGSGISGLTTGKVPKAASATTIGDSTCLSESGSAVSFGSCTATIGATVTLDATWGVILPMTISTTTPVSPTKTGFYLCNRAGCTYNLPTITSAGVGAQMCFRNAVTRTGAITLQAPASTSIDASGANGTAAGTLVSAGALGDAVCVVAQSTTQYVAYTSSGSWTNN